MYARRWTRSERDGERRYPTSLIPTFTLKTKQELNKFCILCAEVPTHLGVSLSLIEDKVRLCVRSFGCFFTRPVNHVASQAPLRKYAAEALALSCNSYVTAETMLTRYTRLAMQSPNFSSGACRVHPMKT